MNKIKTTLIALIFIVGINTYIWAADMIRYDFQIDAGEGTQELYRIDVDPAQKKGELCFLNTGSSGIPEEKLILLRKGAIWSKHVDMAKEEHACFKFDTYDPLGWFYSPPFKYGNQELQVFFIGSLKKEEIKGSIYQFIRYQEDGKEYRTVLEREIIERRISNATVRAKKKVDLTDECNHAKDAETQRGYRFPRTGRPSTQFEYQDDRWQGCS